MKTNALSCWPIISEFEWFIRLWMIGQSPATIKSASVSGPKRWRKVKNLLRRSEVRSCRGDHESKWSVGIIDEWWKFLTIGWLSHSQYVSIFQYSDISCPILVLGESALEATAFGLWWPGRADSHWFRGGNQILNQQTSFCAFYVVFLLKLLVWGTTEGFEFFDDLISWKVETSIAFLQEAAYRWA